MTHSIAGVHNVYMVFRRFSLMLLALVTQTQAQARESWHGGHARDGDSIYRETRQGMIKPLGAIVNDIEPSMRRRGADYIGAEYDEETLRYRLKFMHDGSVIWVDVDGRNGAIIGEAGQ